MSYKDELINLQRDGDRSLTQQLVDVISGAIESGELAPDAKLPPTRELAELAAVNHLTAVRAYKRLRELGLVSAHVGRGTFVRGAAQPPHGARVPDSIAWQRYALPPSDETYGDRVLAEMHRQATMEGLVPLSVGYPSERLFPIAEIAEATKGTLRDHGAGVLQYSDVQGLTELAEQIAELSAARGAPEDPDDIMITNGAAQGLSLACAAILRPGDTVACEDPTFPSITRAIRDAGARIVPVPVDDDGLDVDALERALVRYPVKLVALQPACHNPTGRHLSDDRRRRLLELARERSFFVLEDGVYSRLTFEGEPPAPLRGQAPGHVIYVDSLSKTVGGGMRVGWVAARGPVFNRLVGLKLASDLNSSPLDQRIAARYLAGGGHERLLDHVREEYRVRAAALRTALDRHLAGEFDASEPLGGNNLWLTLKRRVDERALYAEALRQGVSFTPGHAVLVEEPQRASMRLSFSLVDEETLDEGIRRLAVAYRAVLRADRFAATAPFS
jgi:2-aminoadipate transaminase